MSIMHGCVDILICLDTSYFLCNTFLRVYIHLIQYTVIVLEALVHEEVSRQTLRCLHYAKYQCTANQ